MGTPITIKSELDAENFLKQMIDVINKRGHDPTFTGYFRFEKADEENDVTNSVWIKIRAIDAVEDVE